MNIYVVRCSDWDGGWNDKAFVRKDMADCCADDLNQGNQHNGFWASVDEVLLVE